MPAARLRFMAVQATQMLIRKGHYCARYCIAITFVVILHPRSGPHVETPGSRPLSLCMPDHPHAGGENFCWAAGILMRAGPSPRGWGEPL